MTLTEFLEARIAEDEARLPTRPNLDAVEQRRLRLECEAKRRIVEAAGRFFHPTSSAPHAEALAHVAVTALATIYADHPDYREEWRP